LIKPKVTIGVCVRNGEDHIRDAILSIIGQDFPHELMEVIFVDDGSEDRTLSIIESYVPKMNMQMKVFHQEWKGLGETRNVVVNNANGEYIIWVDCDMKLTRDFVRKQVGFMDRNEKVAVARGRFRGLPSNSLVATLENLEWIAIDYLANKEENMDEKLHFCGGSIYRVDALRNVGGFDDRIKGAGEDEDIEYRLRKAGWLVTEGAKVIFYEKRKDTWKALWNQYFWYGFSAHLIPDNKKTMNTQSLLVQLLYSKTAYKLTGRKIAFLLPFQYCFKAIALFAGFLKVYAHK